MNNFRNIALLFTLLFAVAFSASAQLRLPQASPKAVIMQTIGITDVTIKYHSPSVKGREIFGKLVPYGKIWRTGANEANIITISDDITINKERVPGGKYSLFTFPESETSWYLVLNSDTTLWGTENYDSNKDIARIPITASPDDFYESLQFSFNNLDQHGANLNINWENLRLTVRIETDVEGKMIAYLKKALAEAKSDNWLVFSQAANYLIQNNMQHELALEWVNRSIAIKDNFYNNYVKARLLAQKNEYEEATNLTKKAIRLGQAEPESYKTFSTEIERALNEWKNKAD